MKRSEEKFRKMFDLESLSKYGNKTAIRWQNDSNNQIMYLYKSVISDSRCLMDLLATLLPTTESSGFWKIPNIAVFLSHSPAILPAVIGIVNKNCAVCFIDPDVSLDRVIGFMKKYETNMILLESSHKIHEELRQNWDVEANEILLANRRHLVIQIQSSAVPLIPKIVPEENCDVSKSSRVFFCALTSGTSGESKLIRVTYKCFMENVFSLSRLYEITTNDVIFASSPPTFDPFMIDLVLAVTNGATLVLVPKALRLSPSKLLESLFGCPEKDGRVTIMQMTPSLFMKWTTDEIKDIILAQGSSLRILVLGGELFPSKEVVSQWQDWSSICPKRIFNIYGLTEISCWASMCELTKELVFDEQEVAGIEGSDIPIGSHLDDHIFFKLRSLETNKIINYGVGELIVSSSYRKCYLEGSDDSSVISNNYPIEISTGDVVELTESNKMFFRSRANNIIKFFGRKVNLNSIEETTKKISGIQSALCVHSQTKRCLILFIICKKTSHSNPTSPPANYQKCIRQYLTKSNSHIPNEIVEVEEFPLSAHGKISKAKLLEMFESRCEDAEESIGCAFICKLKQVIGVDLTPFSNVDKSHQCKRQRSDLDSSFVQLGGTSLNAMYLTSRLEEMYCQSFPRLLAMLLDDKNSVMEIFSYLQEFRPAQSKTDHVSNERSKSFDILENLCWNRDLKKCIDANPTICHISDGRVVVSVGSHSHLLMNIDVYDGSMVSSFTLPDRIEGQVTQYGSQFGIVGCYDGFLYCFNILSGDIIWKFDSGGMIKCRPLCNGAAVIFGNYNPQENVWCLNVEDGRKIWSKKVGCKSVYSSPCVTADENVIICTLSGECAKLNAQNGDVIWSIVVKSPIFSTPYVIQSAEKEFIIFAAVNGQVRCVTGGGQTIWNHEIDGNIFSSFDSLKYSTDNDLIDIFFGSHNHYVYCLQFNMKVENIREIWKTRTESKITSTPRQIRINAMLCLVSCLTNGFVYIMDAQNGEIIHRFNVPGEIYSSPAIFNNKIFVGCRNNNIYCFDIATKDISNEISHSNI